MSARHRGKPDEMARTCNPKNGRNRYGTQQESQENYPETNVQEIGSDEAVGGGRRMEPRKELGLNQEESIEGWCHSEPAYPMHACYDLTRSSNFALDILELLHGSANSRAFKSRYRKLTH
jgi:hypothetical protein